MKIAIWKPEAEKVMKQIKVKWGEKAEIHFFDRIEEIFDLVENGEMEYGVIPANNNEPPAGTWLPNPIHHFRTHEVFIVEEIKKLGTTKNESRR